MHVCQCFVLTAEFQCGSWVPEKQHQELPLLEADLQSYRFEPERVPNAEDRESENEEVNDRSEGTFWCTCERCETIPTQRECVCCREELESENKKLWKE